MSLGMIPLGAGNGRARWQRQRTVARAPSWCKFGCARARASGASVTSTHRRHLGPGVAPGELLAERGFNPGRRACAGANCTSAPCTRSCRCWLRRRAFLEWLGCRSRLGVTADVSAVWPGQIILGTGPLFVGNIIRLRLPASCSAPSFAEPSAQSWHTVRSLPIVLLWELGPPDPGSSRPNRLPAVLAPLPGRRCGCSYPSQQRVAGRDPVRCRPRLAAAGEVATGR